MAFTREDMAAYEAKPQTVVDDKANPFDGATPAKAADAAAVAAVASGKTDATPAAKKPANDTVTDPSGDDVDSGDQTVTGDGASDDNADSSTASAGRSGESDLDESGEDPNGDEAPPAQRAAPKKGSAAERIQELLDLTEGYKEYGQLKDTALKEALAELARLKAGDGASTPAKQAPTAPPADVDEPMPDLSDPDINFDTDKLRAKTQKWVDERIAKGTQRVVKEITGQTAAERLEADVNAKVATFAASHSDWEAKVAKNPVLIANQLSPVASLAVARSEHTADILYAFGNEPALAIRVAKQTPEQQLISLGRIVGKIEAAKEAATSQPNNGQQNPAGGAKPAKQKSLTQAPPPPTPTKAAGRPAERDVTDPNMSMEEFARKHRDGKQAKRVAFKQARGL